MKFSLCLIYFDSLNFMNLYGHFPPCMFICEDFAIITLNDLSTFFLFVCSFWDSHIAYIVI